MAPIPEAGQLERLRAAGGMSAVSGDLDDLPLPLPLEPGQEPPSAAGSLPPAELRTLDAIHVATAQQLGSDLARVVTYDERLHTAAQTAGCTGVAPR